MISTYSEALRMSRDALRSKTRVVRIDDVRWCWTRGAVQFHMLKAFFNAVIDATPEDEHAKAREAAAELYANNQLFDSDYQEPARESQRDSETPKSMRSSIIAVSAAMAIGKKQLVGSKNTKSGFMDLIAGA
jgi:hypothetical protein